MRTSRLVKHLFASIFFSFILLSVSETIKAQTPTWQVQSNYFGTVNSQSQPRSMRGIALTKDNTSLYVGYIQGSSTSAVRKVNSAIHSTFGADAAIIGNYISGPPTTPTYTGTYPGTNPAYTGGATGVLQANLTNSSRTFRNLATDDRGYVYAPDGADASDPEIRIYDAGLNPAILGSFTMTATGSGRGIKILKVGSTYYCIVASNGGKIERWNVTNVGSPTLDVSWGKTTGGANANGRIDLLTVPGFIGNLGLTVEPDGTLYVANGATNNATSSIVKISNNGDLQTVIQSTVPYAYDVAVFRSKLYVVKYNSSTSSIAILNKSDLSNAGTMSTGISHPFAGDTDNGYSGIDVSIDGKLYVVDQIYENRPGTTPYTPPATSFNPAPTVMAGANILFDRVLVSSSLVPTVVTTAATSVTNSSAILNGTVNSNGSLTDVTFDYGTTNAYGTTVAGLPSPVIGASTTPVSANASPLSPNTLYHYRVNGTSAGGTSNGNDISFTTLANVPSAPTVGNPTTTTLDVTVNPNGNPANTQFAIHETSTNKYVQADGSLGASAVWQTASAWGTKTVTGLNPNTTYTFEVKARNGDNIETAFGPSASGTTVALTTFYVNDDSQTGDQYTSAIGDDVNGNGTSSKPYRTINKAISVALAGNTIYVDAGSYPESTSPDKQLTLLGTNANISPNTGSRVAESIITAAPMRITTTSQVIIKGFMFTSTSTAPIDDYTADGQVTIEKNLFDGTPNMYFNSPDFLYVIDNRFKDLANTDEGLFVAGDYNGTTGTYADIHDNTWINGVTSGMNLSNVKGIVYNNTFTNKAYYCILVASLCNLDIYQNVFDGTTNPGLGSPTWGAGVRFFTPSPGLIANVRNNYFTNNYIGVGVRNNGGDGSLAGTTVNVNNNSFTGNTNKAIKNQAAQTLEASCNWYGTTNAAAVAAQIEGPVTFVPYLTNGTDNDLVTPGFQPVPGSCSGVLPVHNITQGTNYATIQAAVNAANPNDVIVADAGTYVENVDVNKPLTIKGAQNGVAGNSHVGAESIVDANYTGAGFTVNGVNNVIIDGFTVIKGADGFNCGISFGNGTNSNIQILNNIISGNHIGIGGFPGSSCAIKNNLLDANNYAGPIPAATGTGIYLESSTGLTIENNEIRNHDGNAVLFAATTAVAHTNLTFKSNNVHDNAANVYCVSVATGNFTQNTISQIDATCLSFAGACTNISVTNNFISGNARGIRIDDQGYGYGNNSNIVINNNSFTGGFSEYAVGVLSGYSGILNAECNWWNSANGPTHTSNPSGTGEKVTDNVDFTPWLTDGTDNDLVTPGFQPSANSCVGGDATANANLSNLVLSQGTLVPAFAPNTTSYTASVPNSTTSITVTPTTEDPNATVTVNGSPVGPYGPELITGGDMNSAAPYTLSDGASISGGKMNVNSGSSFNTFATQSISIVTGHTYKIEFDVSNYSSGVFHFGLGSAYDGNYSGDISGNGHVSLNITLTSATAPHQIVFFSWTPVPVLQIDNLSVKDVSGNTSNPIPLAVGSNIITIVVTAANGTTTKTYTVDVTRAAGGGGPSSNANLSNLVLSTGALTPPFAPGTTNYTQSVPNSTTSTTVTPTAEDPNATITVNGAPLGSGGPELITGGDMSSAAPYTLSDGASISGGKMNVNSGSSFSTFATQSISIVSGHTYTIEFDVSNYSSGVFHFGLGSVYDGNYSGDISGNGHVSLNITLTSATAPHQIVFFSWTPVPVLQIDNLSVKEAGGGNTSSTIPLNVGSNIITTVVTAADGTTTKTYTVNVTRAAGGGGPSSNANLSNLVLSTGALTPPFAPGTTNYTQTVPNSTTSTTVTPTAEDPAATITVNGAPLGANGPELVTGGDMNSAAPYTLSDGASISGGKMNVNSGSSFTTFATQSISIVSGHTYKIEFDISNYSSGVFHVGLGSAFDGNYSGDISGNGHVSLNITFSSASAPHQIVFFSWIPVPVLQIDNLSVKEVGSGNSSTIPLAVGSNIITTVVTAADGVTTKTYTVNVTRDGAGFRTYTVASNEKDDKGTKDAAIITPLKNVTVTGTTDPKMMIQAKVIRAYPNPSAGKFTLELSGLTDPEITVTIENNNGQRIIRRSVRVPGMMAPLRVDFNLGNQASGIYFVKVKSKDGVQIAKVVVQH